MHKVCKIDGICRATFPRAMKQSFLEQRPRIAATCLVFCLLFPALAQQTPTPPPANPPSNEPQPAQPGQPKPAGPAAPAAGAPVDSNSYKVGSSDVLLVRVWGEPEFSGAVAVQQNGNF